MYTAMNVMNKFLHNIITYRKTRNWKDGKMHGFVQWKKASLNGSLTAACGRGCCPTVGIALSGICGGLMIFSNGFFLEVSITGPAVANNLSTSTNLVKASSKVLTFGTFSIATPFVPFLKVKIQ